MNIDLIDLKKINSDMNQYNINTIEINSIRIILSIKQNQSNRFNQIVSNKIISIKQYQFNK